MTEQMWDRPTLWWVAGRLAAARPPARLMLRALGVATLVLAVSRPAFGQALSVLHIRVVLVGAGQKPTPVPRHALLVSDNPPTAVPRKIVTALDGTADVKLRPGSYTVESDRPVAFNGTSIGRTCR